MSWSHAHSYMHTWFLSLLVPCPLHPQSQEGKESILHTFASATFSVSNLGAARSLLLVSVIKGRERREEKCFPISIFLSLSVPEALA